MLFDGLKRKILPKIIINGWYMSLYKASPNDRFILGFAMVCYMNVLVCCNLFTQKTERGFGSNYTCNQHTYIYIHIHIYIYTHTYIYIHIYIYFSTPGIQTMGKLTSFGVDMFFLNLLESKKWENWLVLVLTCFFSTSWNPKNGKIIY